VLHVGQSKLQELLSSTATATAGWVEELPTPGFVRNLTGARPPSGNRAQRGSTNLSRDSGSLPCGQFVGGLWQLRPRGMSPTARQAHARTGRRKRALAIAPFYRRASSDSPRFSSNLSLRRRRPSPCRSAGDWTQPWPARHRGACAGRTEASNGATLRFPGVGWPRGLTARETMTARARPARMGAFSRHPHARSCPAGRGRGRRDTRGRKKASPRRGTRARRPARRKQPARVTSSTLRTRRR
jgi:hypothetical protein